MNLVFSITCYFTVHQWPQNLKWPGYACWIGLTQLVICGVSELPDRGFEVFNNRWHLHRYKVKVTSWRKMCHTAAFNDVVSWWSLFNLNSPNGGPGPWYRHGCCLSEHQGALHLPDLSAGHRDAALQDRPETNGYSNYKLSGTQSIMAPLKDRRVKSVPLALVFK